MRDGRFVGLLRPRVVLLAPALLLAGALQAQQPVTLTADDGMGGDKFGISASLDGDALIVGASGANIGLASDAGAAYVLRWNGATWEQEQRLVAADAVQLEMFGSAVGVRGDLCVVGVPNRKLGLKVNAGAILVFTRVEGTWVQQQALTANDAAAFDYFGGVLALAQDRLVVGVPAHDVAGVNMQGVANVYRWDGAAFVFEKQLTAPDGLADDRFGTSVDVDGDLIVVGAPDRSDHGATESGAAYVYRLVGGTWQYRQKLFASDGLSFDHFGNAVAVDDDLIAAGVPGDDFPNAANQGSTYVYRYNGSTFASELRLAASDGTAGDEFGTDVDLDVGVLAVGAPRADADALTDVGSAYLFRDSGAAWSEEHLEAPADISAAALFGNELALDGGLLAFGVGSDMVGAFAVQGSACVFKAQSAAWTWLGHALPGQSGAPDLVGGGPLTGGSPVSFVVDDARKNTPAGFTVSLTALNAPFKGGTLVPAPDIVLAGLLTDVQGALGLQSIWPPGMPHGTPVIYQAWFVDAAATQGFSGSNAIIGTVP